MQRSTITVSTIKHNEVPLYIYI